MTSDERKIKNCTLQTEKITFGCIQGEIVQANVMMNGRTIRICKILNWAKKKANWTEKIWAKPKSSCLVMMA